MTPKDYAVAQRQWKREHRIAHAKMKLKSSVSPTDIAFWTDVLKIYGARR